VTDKDPAIASFPKGGNISPDRLAAYDDLAEEDWPADAVTGLVSLGFIKAAIRRSAYFCWVMAFIGFVVGCGLYVAFPSSYQASTSVLLTASPYEDANTAVTDDQAITQSRAVAALAAQELGLPPQDVGSLLASYKALPVTNRVLLISLTAPSADQAVLRASAVAKAFLQVRANNLENEQSDVLASLNQQVSQARQNVSSITSQISSLSAQTVSSAQQSQLTKLRTELLQANASLTNSQEAVNSNKTSIQPAISAAMKNSDVLDAASLLPHSRLKHLLLYPLAGLVGGLVLGIAIVVVRALMSDRLYRRDDVAYALGAPVKFSIRAVRSHRWLPGRHTVSIGRIAAFLGRAVPAKARSMVTLATVAVDNPEVAARALVSVAASCAQQGRQVVLADLAIGAPAARLLGAGGAGVRAVDVDGAHLVLAVPEPADVEPAGPLGRAPVLGSAFTEGVAAACARSDLLLTLATLDPSVGGEYLSTWADDAVAIITAGRSSWTRINAAGEMIRMSGTRLIFGVLVGADKSDESLGLTDTSRGGRDSNVTGPDLHSEAGSRLVTVDDGQGNHRPGTGEHRRRLAMHHLHEPSSYHRRLLTAHMHEHVGE
jgi:hypothetical protein